MPESPRPQSRSAELAGLPRTLRVRVRPRSRAIAFSSLPLSNRLSHSLARHSLRRLRDVDDRTVADLLALHGFGMVSAWELLAVLKEHRHLDPKVVFPPEPLLRPRGAMPTEMPSSNLVLVIRPAARAIPFERCVLSNWLRGTFDHEGMTRVGDLSGWSFGRLRKLRRFGRVQSRQLLHLLASNDLLEPAVRFSFDAPRSERLAALAAMAPRAARQELARGAAPKKVLPYVVLGIAAKARSTALRDLLLPADIKAKLRKARYVRLGDLHGVVVGELARGKAGLGREDLAVLHGLLRAEGALVAGPPAFAVPARWHRVPVDEVEMPPILRLALEGRGVRTLGDLGRLKPEQLGWCFGPVRAAALRELVLRLRR